MRAFWNNVYPGIYTDMKPGDQERVEAMLDDLAALSRKHEILLAFHGIEAMNEEQKATKDACEYILDEDGDLDWVAKDAIDGVTFQVTPDEMLKPGIHKIEILNVEETQSSNGGKMILVQTRVRHS